MESAGNFAAAKEQLEELIKRFSAASLGIEEHLYKQEVPVKAVVAEEAKRRKELTTIEKGKQTSEEKLRELTKFVNDQLTALKKASAEAEAAQNKLTTTEQSFASLNTMYTQEQHALARDKELKETLEKKKNETAATQKTQIDAQNAENEAFKNDLESKLKDRNQELHDKNRTMEGQLLENQTLTEKLDDIEKQIEAQQQSYKDDYEKKKSEIGKHKEKINTRIAKIEEDIAKLPDITEEKGKLSDEIKDLEETLLVVNARQTSLKQRLEACDATYKKLNKYMASVKVILKNYDTETRTLETEIEKSRKGMESQIDENIAIRTSVKSEQQLQAKMFTMIGDFEAKIQKLRAEL